MFLCSKQPVKNERFLVPTNHFFEVTIANYMPLAFRKCISQVCCNSSPKSHSPFPKELWLQLQVFCEIVLLSGIALIIVFYDLLYNYSLISVEFIKSNGFRPECLLWEELHCSLSSKTPKGAETRGRDKLIPQVGFLAPSLNE